MAISAMSHLIDFMFGFMLFVVGVSIRINIDLLGYGMGYPIHFMKRRAAL